MCGRFTQTKSREEVLEEIGNIELPPLFHGRYNVAPTQHVAVIHQDNTKKAVEAVWGFQNPHSGAPIINARSETVHERTMFRNLLTRNRCLIPADGFYEWKGRQPYYFQCPDQRLFAFAGLWSANRCVIITRAGDANMQGVHDRMPVILRQAQWDEWLGAYHIPEIPPALRTRPVSTRVNSVANDDPACLDPGEEQIDLGL